MRFVALLTLASLMLAGCAMVPLESGSGLDPSFPPPPAARPARDHPADAGDVRLLWPAEGAAEALRGEG